MTIEKTRRWGIPSVRLRANQTRVAGEKTISSLEYWYMSSHTYTTRMVLLGEQWAYLSSHDWSPTSLGISVPMPVLAMPGADKTS
jgi:hypothetical protein